MKESHRYYAAIMPSGGKEYWTVYEEARRFACSLADQLPEVTRIVFLSYQFAKSGWLDHLYGRDILKKMKKGYHFQDCSLPCTIGSMQTYLRNAVQNNDIVITMGLEAEHLFKLEGCYGIRAIIAIPWVFEKLEPWIEEAQAHDFRE